MLLESPSPNAPPSRCVMPGLTPTPAMYSAICAAPAPSAGASNSCRRQTLVWVSTLFQVPSNNTINRRAMAPPTLAIRRALWRLARSAGETEIAEPAASVAHLCLQIWRQAELADEAELGLQPVDMLLLGF